MGVLLLVRDVCGAGLAIVAWVMWRQRWFVRLPRLRRAALQAPEHCRLAASHAQMRAAIVLAGRELRRAAPGSAALPILRRVLRDARAASGRGRATLG